MYHNIIKLKHYESKLIYCDVIIWVIIGYTEEFILGGILGKHQEMLKICSWFSAQRFLLNLFDPGDHMWSPGWNQSRNRNGTKRVCKEITLSHVQSLQLRIHGLWIKEEGHYGMVSCSDTAQEIQRSYLLLWVSSSYPQRAGEIVMPYDCMDMGECFQIILSLNY